jgi:hypothetical protein
MDSFQVIGNVFSQYHTVTAISNYSAALSTKALTYAEIFSSQATIYATIVHDQATMYAGLLDEQVTIMRPVIQSYILAFFTAMIQAHELAEATKKTIITTLTPYANAFFTKLYDISLRAQAFHTRNPDTLAIVLATGIATYIIFALFSSVFQGLDEQGQEQEKPILRVRRLPVKYQ